MTRPPRESEVMIAEPVEAADAAIVDEQSQAPSGLPCPACGGPVESWDKFCPSCGSPTPQEQPAGASPEVDRKQFQCKNCGAAVKVDASQRSYVCPFCDSTYVVELPADDQGRQPPEFIIGFEITKEQAEEAFRLWIATNSWFRPGDLKTSAVLEKMKGVYLPFWSFSMLAASRWSAQIGEYWYRTETYTTTDSKGNTVTRTRQVRETEWHPLSGRHHQYLAGYLVSASKGLPQQAADTIQPFQLPALRRYKPFYLAGWLSEEYEMPRDQALTFCQQEFRRRQQQAIERFMPGDTYRNVRADTAFSHINSDLCLLPVFVLSYHYKDQLYRFLVNGQTGRTAGDKPVSWRRIGVAIGVGIGLLILAALVGWLLAGMT